jgi:hypothetical protein
MTLSLALRVRRQSMWKRTDEWVKRNHARALGLGGPLSPTSWVNKQRLMAPARKSADDARAPLPRGLFVPPSLPPPLLEQVAGDETTFVSVTGGCAFPPSLPPPLLEQVAGDETTFVSVTGGCALRGS